MRTDLESLESIIGYSFKDINFLKVALTHSSYSNEMKINKCDNYERQEFLGDAVLEMVSSDYLYNKYSDTPEGELTKLRASLVCEPSLAFCAREIGLHEFIRLGRGEEATGGRNRDSIISDVFEATIGAIYLDGGIESARSFIYSFVLKNEEEHRLFYDAKSMLQCRVQANGQKLEYVITSETGPEHAKCFNVDAIIDGIVCGSGSGNTKKAAQQAAAVNVLRSNKCI